MIKRKGMRTELIWHHLKELNQSYITGKTESKITNNRYIKNVLIAEKKLIKHKLGIPHSQVN